MTSLHFRFFICEIATSALPQRRARLKVRGWLMVGELDLVREVIAAMMRALIPTGLKWPCRKMRYNLFVYGGRQWRN
ncbi:MAG: hypothetical protein GF363_12075 [Chitinivibrionales bacterium]|nr:hypothetical protein [Chitinivibrionales bacterium]